MSRLRLKKESLFQFTRAAILSTASMATGLLVATSYYYDDSCDKANNAAIKEVHLRYNSHLSDRLAYQVAADVGHRNMLGSATLGLAVTDADFLKISGECRLNDFDYDFTRSEPQRARMHQTALGAAYQRSLVWGPVTSVDVSAGWSLSNSRKLGLSLIDVATNRFIGGTQFYGATVGVTVFAWESATAHFAINYDYMNINRHFSNDRKGSGLGFSAKLIQAINSEVSAEVKAELRRPFNLYAASLNYSGLSKNMVVGVFAQGVKAFYHLPDSSSIGLSLTYTVCDELASESTKGLVEWVNIPAFSQPEVLVATDQEVGGLG